MKQLFWRIGALLAIVTASCGDDDVLIQLPFLPPPPEDYAPTCASDLERDDAVVLLQSADIEEMKGVTVVHGDLTIATTAIALLDDGIDCVERIEGDLIIENVAGLEGIGPNGLSRLEEVTGDIIVTGNPVLATPLPLFALTEVGGNIHVESNPALRSIGDMAVLESVGGSLVLKDHDAMSFVPTLSALSTLGGDLVIEGANALDALVLGTNIAVQGQLRLANNAVLTSATLPSVTGQATSVEVQGHPALQTLVFHDQEQTATLTGTFSIADNGALRSINGLAALTAINGDLLFENNPSLQTIEGFTQLAHVAGNIVIANNAQLVSTSGLKRITSVASSLTISGNAALAGVQFDALTAVGAALSIAGNDALYTLDGLDALSTVGALLHITQNPSLSNCSAQAFADRLIANGLSAANAQVSQNGDC